MSNKIYSLKRMPAEAFKIFAMSLPHGPNYGNAEFLSAWSNEKGLGYGAVLQYSKNSYGLVVLRRREDYVLVPIEHKMFFTEQEALVHLDKHLSAGGDLLPIPSGQSRRARLDQVGERNVCQAFVQLSSTIKYRGAFHLIAEFYLALPKPDDNFITDLQTRGFNSRIWELYLFACFKEQGIKVFQDYPSPDFMLMKDNKKAYVEAVTANPTGPGSLKLPQTQFPPKDRLARTAGDMAARFAKTIRSKLQRKYEELPHVKGFPFAIAIADFSGGGTMVWSRESLPTYLYGQTAHTVKTSKGIKAAALSIEQLIGHENIPAGLFNHPEMENLSAILFSNAGTLPKFQRMAIQAEFSSPVVKARRVGILFDRTEGALEPIDFDLDIQSPEYINLCDGKEFWCFELEVFHNPNAAHPMPHDFLPGATHWFEHNGEIICETQWKNQVLASVTEFSIVPDVADKLEGKEKP
ncbi:hypothetical protein FHW31_000043 [Enterobacter asburiae]|uniref:hypothetical protein n=1 Tax=Enterobacter asburiae TaxID=61645 RepID=UPI00141B558E|nr:hypothetical protein [Enterobacter asburiae]NIH88678.1 hypothetical protein [Enterobacter asburiae]